MKNQMKVKENKYLIYDHDGKEIDIKYIIKYILFVLIEPFLKIICLLPFKTTSKKYNISFCTIFKDEAPYLKEWIDFHQLIGVQHFYMYNNNSTDNYQEILAPYVEQGLVTLIDWPTTPGQLPAYKHWLENYKTESKWVSFADVDEFYCPLKDNNLNDWLERNSRFPVLLVYWKMFGASSKIEHNPNELVIEQYTACFNKLYEIGKQFYNTDYNINEMYINNSMHHHLEVNKFGIMIPPINVYGHFVKWGCHRGSSKEVEMQMNHYNIKALDTYVTRHKKGDSAFAKSWRSFGQFVKVETECKTRDFNIQRFLLLLKLKQRGIDGNDLF